MTAIELIIGIFATVVGAAIVMLVGKMIATLSKTAVSETRLNRLEQDMVDMKIEMRAHRSEAQVATKELAESVRESNAAMSKKLDDLYQNQGEILLGLVNAGVLERRDHGVKAKGR